MKVLPAAAAAATGVALAAAAPICAAHAAEPMGAGATTPQPFSGSVELTDSNAKAVGAKRTLSIGSLTLTSFSNNVQQIRFFNALTADADCAGAVTGAGQTQTNVELQPHQTLHLDFPSPLIMPSLGTGSCIAFEDDSGWSGNIDVLVVGTTAK